MKLMRTWRPPALRQNVGRPLWGILLWCWACQAGAADALLRPGDVLAWLGGAQVVAAQRSGFDETLVAVARPDWKLRWRSLAWEGDTVFVRPREVNFPSISHQLQEAGATVTALQFGTMESLAGPEGIPSFVAAYGRLLDEVAAVTPRRILVIPPPVAWGTSPSRSPAPFSPYAAAIHDLGLAKGVPVVDLYTAVTSASSTRTPSGMEAARTLASVLVNAPAFTGAALAGDTGQFSQPDIEALRQAVIARNRLWFDYTRPMNWAFLGGDRTDQLSSRDHRDRNIRWFPAEMERFVPLIAAADEQVWKQSEAASKGIR